MNPIIDRSAPGVRITLLADERAESGEPLELGSRIIGFTFDDAESKADKLSLQLDNQDLSLFDREDLMGGATLEVSWGYAGNMAVPRRVVVKKLKGFTTLEVEGQALSTLMNREAKTRSWENVTRSSVVRQIAEELAAIRHSLGAADAAIETEPAGAARDRGQTAETGVPAWSPAPMRMASWQESQERKRAA